MNNFRLFLAAFAALVLGGALDAVYATNSERSVGFQWATAPDAHGPPLTLAIWYPSDQPARHVEFGPFNMNVAFSGTIKGTGHPLIVMSHGTGASPLNSYNLATSLADAGFIVVAITHKGDNYQDQSNAFTRSNFIDRLRHVSKTIDFMLDKWRGHAAIDPARIGLFGHSAGGTTGLIAVGGQLEWGKVVSFCRSHADDWGCRKSRQRGSGDAAASAESPPIANADPRIHAAVLAAPALSHGFAPRGLSGVSVPVELWVASNDEIARDATLVRSLLPSPVEYHLVSNAGHFSFLAPCSAMLLRQAPEICADPQDFDRSGFQREFAAKIGAFFQTNLRSDQ